MDSEFLELKTAADENELAAVIGFVDELLDRNNCVLKKKLRINVAIEELFVNIAHYAYPSGGGWAILRAGVKDGVAEFTLIDGGIPYDPLAKPDPDTTLDADEREIGGLGIFIVKRTMDYVRYSYEDGKNVLTIGCTL